MWKTVFCLALYMNKDTIVLMQQCHLHLLIVGYCIENEKHKYTFSIYVSCLATVASTRTKGSLLAFILS